MAVAATALALLKSEMACATHEKRKLLTTSALEHCESASCEDYFTFIDWNELEEQIVSDDEDEAWFEEQERRERAYEKYAREVYSEISRTLHPYCTAGDDEDTVKAPWDTDPRTKSPQRNRWGAF